MSTPGAAMLGPMRHPFGTASLAAKHEPLRHPGQPAGRALLQDCMGEAISPLVHQPGRMVYQIIDRAGAERTMKESAGRPCDVPGADMNPFYQNWEAELEQERQWGVLFSAPTLEALGGTDSHPGGPPAPGGGPLQPTGGAAGDPNRPQWPGGIAPQAPPWSRVPGMPFP